MCRLSENSLGVFFAFRGAAWKRVGRVKTPRIALAALLFASAPFSSAKESEFFYEPFEYELEEGSLFRNVAIFRPGLLGSWKPPGYAPQSLVEFQRESLDFGEAFPTHGGSLRFRTDESNSDAVLEAVMESPLEGEVWHSFLFKLAVIPSDYASYIQSMISRHACTGAKAGNTGIKLENQPRPGIGYSNRPALKSATSEAGAALPADLPLEVGIVYFAVSRFTRIGQEITEETPGEASLWVFDEFGFDKVLKACSSKPVTDEILSAHAVWTASNVVTSMNWDKIQENGYDRFSLQSFRGQDSIFDEVRLGPSFDSVIPGTLLAPSTAR